MRIKTLKCFNIIIAAVALLGCSARPARAQFIGYTSPQTTQQTLAPAGTLCNTLQQAYTVQNLGQTQHYAYINATGATSLTMQIVGFDAAGNKYSLSDTATLGSQFGSGITTNPVLTASGYFPKVQIIVTCSPATASYVLNYSGASATAGQISGGYQLSQATKVIGNGAPAGTNFSMLLQAPFGSSFGSLMFLYSATGPSGSSIGVQCYGSTGQLTIPVMTFNVVTTTVQQVFPVPAEVCPIANVTYTAGGASSAAYIMEYDFFQAPFTAPNTYTHITGTTATVVKAGPGVIHSVVVGASAAGTISLFDLGSASCTGTPSTNVVSVITEFASAAPPPPAYILDTLFNNGICVKASAIMDIMISSQ